VQSLNPFESSDWCPRFCWPNAPTFSRLFIRSPALLRPRTCSSVCVPQPDEVAAIGPKFAGLTVCQRVFGLVNHSYAEYVVCRLEDVAKTRKGALPQSTLLHCPWFCLNSVSDIERYCTV